MFFVRFCILVIGNVTSYVVLYVILTTYTQSGNYLTSEIAEAISAIRRMGTVVERIEREVEHTRKICEKVPGILLKDVNVFINGVNVLPEIDLNVSTNEKKGISRLEERYRTLSKNPGCFLRPSNKTFSSGKSIRAAVSTSPKDFGNASRWRWYHGGRS
ncbi:hypothetical protein MTP99_002661 [Tenebrio molitor]|nr:hypothetical protein MTP99_002661 [Tenebrio molitor]